MPSVRRPRPAGTVLVLGLLLGACAGPGAAPDAGEAPPAPVESAAAPDLVVHTTDVPPLHPSVDGYPSATVELTAGDGTRHRLAVRSAVTTEQRRHGLMEVPDVPAGTGMVFAYDSDREGAFTMRGTRTPLQIAWADADGRVVALADMVPCVEEPCPTWSPGAAYRTALEVRAGWFDEVGVGVGDRLRVLG